MYLITNFLPIVIIALSGNTRGENVHMAKVFIMAIEPGMFNWTLQDERDQFSYSPSLLNTPDLPSWINYVYSSKHQTGFLYGVPPQLARSTGIELEIIGLNRDTYETRRRVVPINIEEKPDLAKYQVQLKIHNLNVEELFDTQRLSRLLDVFRSRLWISSRDDLHVTMLASAVQLGARLPLRPTEGEGVVLRLGSSTDFSNALRELQEEIKPLWKLSSCPKDFKRTSVERLFREQGFTLDWCSFRLLASEETSVKIIKTGEPEIDKTLETDIWNAPPSRANVPERSYAYEFIVTILVPILVLLLVVMLLSLILCFHHDGIDDFESDEYFDSIFNICEDYLRTKRKCKSEQIQPKRVKEPLPAIRRGTRQVSTSEQGSLSVSPNSSLPRSTSPRQSSETGRPNPPPYMAPLNTRSDI